MFCYIGMISVALEQLGLIRMKRKAAIGNFL